MSACYLNRTQMTLILIVRSVYRMADIYKYTRQQATKYPQPRGYLHQKRMGAYTICTGWGHVWLRGEIKVLIVMAPELGLAKTD